MQYSLTIEGSVRDPSWREGVAILGIGTGRLVLILDVHEFSARDERRGAVYRREGRCEAQGSLLTDES